MLTTRIAALLLLGSPAFAQIQLDWSSYFGGSRNEGAHAVHVDDKTGIVTMAGWTQSPNLPTTVGAFDRTHNGGHDAWVAQFDPSKSGSAQLLWSTYLGGTGYDVVHTHCIDVDASGRVAVVGQTGSANLPTTSNAFDRTWNGSSNKPGVDSDAFIAVFSNTGRLQYLSYFGGTGGQFGDLARAAKWDAQGRLVIAGFTESQTNFPLTKGCYNSTSKGDGFVAVLDPTKGTSGLVYSTFFGNIGRNDGGIGSLAVEPNGTITIVGSTWAAIPTTVGAYDRTYNGSEEGFMARIAPQGNGAKDLLYCTYLGGKGRDWGHDVVVSKTGAVLIGGMTSSENFPTTTNAFQRKFAGNYDGVFCRILPLGLGSADLSYSTYLGGSGYDNLYSIAFRGPKQGQVVLSGMTVSPTFPTTAYAAQRTTRKYDAVVALFDLGSASNPGASLVHSTLFGGTESDRFYSACAAGGSVTFVGRTDSTNVPTSNAYDKTANGLFDTLMVQMDLSSLPYGSGLNPDRSLRTLSGRPRTGTNWTLGIDNPTAGAAPRGVAFLVADLAPSGAYPRGAVVPGCGMAGPSTSCELLLANYVLGFGPKNWTRGTATAFPIGIPNTTSLVGVRVFLQGLLIDSNRRLTATQALDVCLGR